METGQVEPEARQPTAKKKGKRRGRTGVETAGATAEVGGTVVRVDVNQVQAGTFRVIKHLSIFSLVANFL